MLDKRYDFKEIEEGRVERWKNAGYFKAGDTSKLPFAMVIPPPNVTGVLHIGHAIDNTFQDIIARYKKLKGFDVLYLPGVDHAGIATQAKVDAKLKEEGKSRYDIGREAFLKEAFAWKEEKSDIIHSQWAKMGIMVDYSRERFTLDDGFQDAVFTVFKTLYDENLIYQGTRIVNYDPLMKTALSNIEINYKEEEGSFFYFKYRFENDKEKYLEIATTRPETMFGDTCIVVNPNDERYKEIVGKNVINPANGDLLPVIADEYVDINFGTGAMKCTPAHDPNDYIIGQKYGFEHPVIMNIDGTMVQGLGKYSGLSREKCREELVNDIKNNGDLIKIEKIMHNVGHSERSDAIVEPILSKQWFVKMKPLADRVLENQKTENKVNFYPARFENVLTRWLSNIDDWCISRQLWWGHRIPVWYKKDDPSQVVVSKTNPGKDNEYYQDEDVLDTWFSSALWPFATLGWPKETPDFKRYYPTNCLVTGYDIIFFWVSRMIFQGLHFTNQVPFKDVVIHGIVRDSQGRKMSKSLGNGIDPVKVIDEYGTDSLRYFLATTAAPGLDMRYSEEKVKAANQYLNKIWNVARFALMNVPSDYEFKNKEFNELNELDQYVLLKLDETIEKVTNAMEKYEFGIASSILYDFVYDIFCDYYIELSKVSLQDDFYNKESVYFTLITCLKEICIMIHPFAPFISDEIYTNLPKSLASIMLETYPSVKGYKDINNVTLKVETLRNIIEKIRAYKVENSLQPNHKLSLKVKSSLDLKTLEKYILRFTFAESLEFSNEDFKDMNNLVIDNATIYIDDNIDKDALNKKLNDQLVKINSEIKRSEGLLNNPNFLAKASEEKVNLEKEKYKNYLAQKEEILKKIK